MNKTALISALLLATALAAFAQDKAPAKPEKTPVKPTGAAPEKADAPARKAGITAMPGIAIDVMKKRIEVDGWVNLQRASQMEFLLGIPRGKSHETLFLMEADPKHLQLGLIMIGLKPKAQVKMFGEFKALEGGDKVVIDVLWTTGGRTILCKACFDGTCKSHSDPLACKVCPTFKTIENGGWCPNCLQGFRWDRKVICKKCWDKDCDGHYADECDICQRYKKEKRTDAHCSIAVLHGELNCKTCNDAQVEGTGWCSKCKQGFKGGKKTVTRVEEWVFNRHRNAALPLVGFVFTGSRQLERRVPPDFVKIKKVFGASSLGNVAALYHDPDSILDIPLLEGGDDTSFVPYTDRIPDRLTRVRLRFRPWTDEDEALMKKSLAASPVVSDLGKVKPEPDRDPRRAAPTRPAPGEDPGTPRPQDG